jgi:copper chaperone
MSKVFMSIKVEGMSCSHCENSIIKAVGAIEGVEGVAVDLKNKDVTVEYDSEKVELGIISDAIEDQGYEVVE